jgi:hypothetical protein
MTLLKLPFSSDLKDGRHLLGLCIFSLRRDSCLRWIRLPNSRSQCRQHQHRRQPGG